MAAEIAAIIGERGLGGDDVDLRGGLNALHRDRSRRGRDARSMAERWAEIASTSPSPKKETELSVGTLIALAYPERIAKNRGGAPGAFLLANGRGATIDAASPLAREPLLAVAELSGSAAAGRILSAAPIALAEIEARFADRIEARDEIAFDAASGGLRGRKSRRLGAIALSDQQMRVEPNEATAKLLADNIARAGIARLPWSKALLQWRDRVMFLRASEADAWPDWSDAALAKSAGDWLAPILVTKTAIGDITADEMATALQVLLPWPLLQRLEEEAPTHFEAPTGSACRSIMPPKADRRSRSACRSCSGSPAIRRSPAAKFLSSSSSCRRRTGRCRRRATCPASGAAATPRCAPRCAAATRNSRGPTIRSRPVRRDGRSRG